ncbi:MAG: cyclase family protein [Acidobacteria bacterium]|nr:cyclase family protein [Acidobacteriota bacterium]
MRSILVMTIAVAFGFGGGTLHAQSWQMPADSQRCPSKWGAGDQRGSGNWMKPDTVLRAARLIRTGEVFELGEVLTPDPSESYINRNRVYNIYTKPSVPVPNTRVGNEELIVTELGQIGTQFDGFAHQMYGDSFYNCFQAGDIITRYGFQKLGVENVGMLMTRGVLIDVAAFKGVEMLSETYVITPEDLQQALARENLALQPGDAVVIHTGWGKLRGKDNARYGRSSPGVGVAAGEWLVRQDPMLIAADNCCVEVRPSEPQRNLPVHTMTLVQHGVYLIENLELEALAAARAYEFAFVVQPLKLKGATGSTVAPVAIR